MEISCTTTMPLFHMACAMKCWTSDTLSRKGLPHQVSFPFCHQKEETISHILLSCVLSREVWFWVCVAMEVWACCMGALHGGYSLDVVLQQDQRRATHKRHYGHSNFSLMGVVEASKRGAFFWRSHSWYAWGCATCGIWGNYVAICGSAKGDLDVFLGTLNMWACRE